MIACLPGHWAHQLLMLVALLWTLPGVWFRPSALVLLVGWAIASDYRCATGVPLTGGTSLIVDLMQIIAICACAWPIWHPMARRERLILALFPLFWISYVIPIHPYYRWWLLWAIQMGQFVLAGPWAAVGRYTRFPRLPAERLVEIETGGGAGKGR